MSEETPIRRKKLSDEVQDRLLAHIREKQLRPGDVLPSERELMALYQVGRPAIREAMQDLQRMGLIEIRHGGRPKLARPSLDGLLSQMGTSIDHLLTHSDQSLGHLKEARILLETEMARIAAQRRTDEDIEALTALIDAQDLARDDSASFLDHDGAFHARIAEISGNPIFQAVSQAIFGWLRLFHIEQVRKRGLEPLTLAEHRLILRGIKEGDAEAAAEAMQDHLTRVNSLYHQNHHR
ncbi:MAG: transcriptional regulator NanR [Mangrovicoccus sp.]